MPWFADLSPYEYSAFAQPGTLNVGWLAVGRPFATGATPEAFRLRLASLCRDHFVHRTAGFYFCPFCPPGGMLMCGSAEIHVAALDGPTFAAPILVAHYVEGHGYRPPEAFIDAVLTGDAVDPVPTDPDEQLAGELLHRVRRGRSAGMREGTAARLLGVVSMRFGHTLAARG